MATTSPNCRTALSLLGLSENSLAAAEDTQNARCLVCSFIQKWLHTEQGRQIIENFLFKVCGCQGDWTPASFVEESISRIRQQIGSGNAICALSGGVDSTVAAVLVDKAIGEHLTCIFVDNGVLGRTSSPKVLSNLKDRLKLKVVGVEAGLLFLRRARRCCGPGAQTQDYRNTFIEVFDVEAQKLGQVDFLVQGTLYPDVIESVSVKGPSATIKSHHNVGGLPEKMKLKLVEPLRELFKDEVRAIGRALGLGDEIIQRQPFPGPGLAVRILGEVTAEPSSYAAGSGRHRGN